MIFLPHDSPFILVFTADARSVGNSQLSCCEFFRDRLPTSYDLLCYLYGYKKAQAVINIYVLPVNKSNSKQRQVWSKTAF